MLPNLLLRPRRIRTCAQNSLHLLHTSKQNLARNKPPNPLMTRRAGQAPLVCPKLIEMQHAIQRRPQINIHRLLNLRLEERDHRRELVEEGGVAVAGIKTEG